VAEQGAGGFAADATRGADDQSDAFHGNSSFSAPGAALQELKMRSGVSKHNSPNMFVGYTFLYEDE
jgi:hypothetical protein